MSAAKKKPKPRTLWFTVAFVHVVDRSTGEVLQRCKALVAKDWLCRRIMRARGYHVGDEIKGVITKGRNYSQFKRAHALGLLAADQIEKFHEFHKDGHGCVKALQRESGIECEEVVETIEAAPIVDAVLAAAGEIVGKVRLAALRAVLPELNTVTTRRIEPRSLSYEGMDQERFERFYWGLCGYIRDTYWHDMTPEQISAQSECMGLEEM